MKYLLVIFASFQIFAQDITIGVFEIKPYLYKGADNQLHGVLVDFLKQIDEEAKGLNFVYKIFPYKRLLEELRSENVDVAIFYENNKAGTNKFKAFSTLGNINYVIGRDSFIKSEFRSNLDLRIGLIRSASYGPRVDSIPRSQKLELKNYHQGIDLMKRGRSNYLVIPSTVLEDYCYKNSCSHEVFKVRDKLNEKNNWFHITSKISKNLVSKIKEAHDRVIEKKGYQYLHDLL